MIVGQFEQHRFSHRSGTGPVARHMSRLTYVVD